MAGLEIQQDDRGQDGVIIVPDGKRRKVRFGTRMSADRVKQSEHEAASQSRAEQEKNAEKNALAVNTQDVAEFKLLISLQQIILNILISGQR